MVIGLIGLLIKVNVAGELLLILQTRMKLAYVVVAFGLMIILRMIRADMELCGNSQDRLKHLRFLRHLCVIVVTTVLFKMVIGFGHE